MKLTLQTPTPEQVAALEATIRTFNAAADWLAGEASTRKTANKIALQKLYYATLRERFGLSAQMAVRCIAQVCEDYKRDKSKRPRFREFAAIPYDQRLMSFKGLDRVSLLTLSGRILVPEEFRCVVCGHTDHADVNAARNIRSKARALVNALKVSEQQQAFLALPSTGTNPGLQAGVIDLQGHKPCTFWSSTAAVPRSSSPGSTLHPWFACGAVGSRRSAVKMRA